MSLQIKVQINVSREEMCRYWRRNDKRLKGKTLNVNLSYQKLVNLFFKNIQPFHV